MFTILKYRSLLILLLIGGVLCCIGEVSNTAIAATPTNKPYDIRIAVASNFYSTLLEIIQEFEESSDYKVSVSSGSSGTLTTQVLRGAPFDLFFSADIARIDKLIKQGAVDESWTRIYAKGRLVLATSSSKAHLKPTWCGLENKQSSTANANNKPIKIALAKPELAPYGKASIALMNSNFSDAMRMGEYKLVYGNNVAQVAQYVSHGSVDYAWLPLSMKDKMKALNKDMCFFEPALASYPEILQKMALLKPNNFAAKDFWNFMESKQVEVILEEAGYLQGIGE